MALTDADTALSPDWWLLRLGRRLRDREKRLDFWKGYYKGDGQRLPQGPSAAGKVYQDFQKKARTNFCMLPVEADVHRLLAIGITDGDGNALPEPWKWWQQNKLDAKQKIVYRTALSLSEGYMSVGSHPRIKRQPLIVPEHPRQVIVEENPATGERRAGLKAYYDDIEGVGKAVVDLGERIFHYVTEPRSSKARLPWGEQSWTLVRDVENPTGRVSFVPFPFQPDLEDAPLPAFAPVIDIQDRINFGVLNRMTAERYSAFRQKNFTGGKVAKTRDPETGLEVAVNPWQPDPGGVWVHESPTGKFGEFSQTDLMGYLKTYDSDIRSLFVICSIPAYYMPGDLINVGADTVVALDTNHIAKVGEEQDFFGEALEEVFQLAALRADYDGDLSDAEVRWKDARQLNPGVVADMGVKKKSMGYPLTMVAEDMGDSPARVERLRAAVAAEQLQARLAARTQQPPAAPTFQAPSRNGNEAT